MQIGLLCVYVLCCHERTTVNLKSKVKVPLLDCVTVKFTSHLGLIVLLLKFSVDFHRFSAVGLGDVGQPLESPSTGLVLGIPPKRVFFS